MKTILTTFNAKYIHSSLALRLLYVVNKDKHDISFEEFTIKENVDTVAQKLIEQQPDAVGISVSIWNVEKSRLLAKRLKELAPNIQIIVGGPEVTYEPDYFLNNWNIDFVISGEGEFVLGKLLDALESNTETIQIDSVSTKERISRVIARADIEKLTTYPSPYQLEEDKVELKNRLIYFESSRGCPYQCQYCLSSLEKGVRYFPQEWLFDNLKYLIDNGAKLIKFLDRTFNLNKEHTYNLFQFLLDNHRPNLSCQFEIYADLLTDEMIDFLNANLPTDFFRFEIGIQSTYEPTNIEVRRKQNFPLLASNIKKLMNGGKIDLHLDLIAGLPYETLERFIKSFNDVFEFGAKEVQLGFLKMLRGTNLRRNAAKYGYIYDANAPYEIICNNDISREELDRIHDTEHALDKYWNSGKFSRTMKHLFENQYHDRYFELFDEIGQFYKEKNLPHIGYQLEDLFRLLQEFLESKKIDLVAILRTDYYHNFRLRPHGFWTLTFDKQTKKRLIYEIGQNKEFLKKYNLTRRIIEKQTIIDTLADDYVELIVYMEEEDGLKIIPLRYCRSN